MLRNLCFTRGLPLLAIIDYQSHSKRVFCSIVELFVGEFPRQFHNIWTKFVCPFQYSALVTEPDKQSRGQCNNNNTSCCNACNSPSLHAWMTMAPSFVNMYWSWRYWFQLGSWNSTSKIVSNSTAIVFPGEGNSSLRPIGLITPK